MSIRHNCETGGCYIKEHSPDWGFLDNSFSGKISVSDIDGAVEANGYLLMLEWKGIHATITQGQEIMFKEITKNSRVMVFVIFGDSLETEPERIVIFKDGVPQDERPCDREYLKKLCEAWESKARSVNGFSDIRHDSNVVPIRSVGGDQ